MKKFISLLILVGFALVASAQLQPTTPAGTGGISPASVVFKTNAGVTKSTITGNDTLTGIFTQIGYSSYTDVEVNIAKASGKIGTVGKVYLYGSVAGVTYEKLDSLSLTNVAANGKILTTSTPNKYYYYKVVAKVDSTHTGTISAKYLIRRNFGN
jgi:hypothetical protein